MRLWPWGAKPEHRASSFESIVTDALVAAATSTDDASGAGLAAVESAAGLIGRCFAAAEVVGEHRGMVTARVLELIGRGLVTRGEALFVIDPDLQLVPVGTWDVRGGYDPRAWWYRADIFGASLHSTRYLQAAGVVHARINPDPVRTWQGRAPWRIAALTSATAANAERSAGKEARIPSARIAPVPATDPEERTKYRTNLKAGGVVSVQAAANPIAGNGQEPANRWAPAVLRPDPTQAHVELRTRTAQDILSACGVPPALADARADGTTRRESYRQLTLATLEPMGRLVAEELSAKLDTAITLDFGRLHGSDLATRGRALKQLVEAGVSLADALGITGLNGEAT